MSEFDAYSMLSNVDFFEIKDSKACAIASKPADALTLNGAEIKKFGIKKKAVIPIINIKLNKMACLFNFIVKFLL